MLITVEKNSENSKAYHSEIHRDNIGVPLDPLQMLLR